MTTGLVTKHWTKGKLQDLVFFQRGFDITKAQQTEGSIPVISSSGVTSYHNEARAAGPGVVIGRKGTLGSVHYSETDYWPHDTTLWSKDLRGSNPRFVYFYLHTINFKRFDVSPGEEPVQVPAHLFRPELPEANVRKGNQARGVKKGSGRKREQVKIKKRAKFNERRKKGRRARPKKSAARKKSSGRKRTSRKTRKR